MSMKYTYELNIQGKPIKNILLKSKSLCSKYQKVS